MPSKRIRTQSELLSTLPAPPVDDVEPPSCPTCGGETKPLGTLGARAHFRCIQCGMDCSEESQSP